MFDPYYQWLGIPPAEQPPHHYRLLSLSLFEPNPELIALSAERQRRFLEAQQTPENSLLVGQILSAIKQAETCLQNPAQKANYDRNLALHMAAASTPPPATTVHHANGTASLGAPAAAQLGSEHLAPASMSEPNPPPQGPAEATFASAEASAYSADATPNWLQSSSSTAAGREPKELRRRGPPKSSPLGKALAVLLPTVLLGVGYHFYGKQLLEKFSRSAAELPADPNGGGKPNANSSAESGKSAPSKSASPKPARSGGAADSAANLADPRNAVPTSSSVAGEPGADSGVGSRLPGSQGLKHGLSNQGHGSQEPPAERVRAPIPSGAAQASALKLANDVFGREIAKANTPERRAAVTDKLVKESRDPTEDAVNVYVLLKMAAEQADGADNLALILQVQNAISDRFATPARAALLAALSSFVKNPATKSASQLAAAEAALKAAEGARDDEDFADGLALARLAYEVVQDRPEGAKLKAQIVALGKDLKTEQAAQEQLAAAQAALHANPQDAAANLMVGRWEFIHGRDGAWTHLAASQDATLRALALQELAPPQQGAAQVDLADAWSAAAKTFQRAAERARGFEQARLWYSRALGSVVGLTKAKVEKRIQEVAADAHSAAAASDPSASAPLVVKTAKDAERIAQRQRTAKRALAIYLKALNDPAIDAAEKQELREKLPDWQKMADQDLRRIGARWLAKDEVIRLRKDENDRLTEGYQAFQDEKFALAERKFGDARNLDSDGIVADFQIGLLDALTVRDMNRAASYFERCVSRRTARLPELSDSERLNLAGALNNLAVANIHMRNLGEAYKSCKAALELGRPAPELMQNLGRLLYLLDNRNALPGRLAFTVEPNERRRWDELQAQARLAAGNDGFDRNSGWRFMPFTSEGDNDTTGVVAYCVFAVPPIDNFCMNCNGTGAVHCTNPQCMNGTVGGTRPEVTKFPDGTRRVVETKIRIPCSVCGGRGTVRCPYCDKGIDPTLAKNNPAATGGK
ncbi:MAG TPA: hypothetical protein VFE24_14640 [Pirellulales bacterium]|jgi:hypothetical protein|nr:hypothetical protein [Pirellulales bacterium]